MNKQNKPIRQHTTWWQRFTRIISRVKSREASRSELWQQKLELVLNYEEIESISEQIMLPTT